MSEHVHAFTLGPSQAAMEDDDFRRRCACSAREPEPAGCPKHRRYWERIVYGNLAARDGVITCPCGLVIGDERDGVKSWLRP